MENTGEVTRLLDHIRDGDGDARAKLLELVYPELRAMAAARFSGQRDGQTLQPTALVHEAWLKLAESVGQLSGRQHFLAVASKAMRQVLADHARAKKTDKRGEGRRPVALQEAAGLSARGEVDVVALHDSLEKLSELNERHARVVELRFLGALTIEETADQLGVSHATVESDWSMARAWLRRELAAC